VLSEVLQRPGMIGYAQTSLKKMQKLHPDSHSASRKPRDYSLREIGYARALFNLGDKSGLGEKILREYARDLRGHFAQHAKAILQKAGKEVKADEPY